MPAILVGAFPVQEGPNLPNTNGLFPTQPQLSGTSGIANRTLTTPTDGKTITATPPGKTLTIYPSMSDPSALLNFFNQSGIPCSLDIAGRFTFNPAVTWTGDANTLSALGLT